MWGIVDTTAHATTVRDAVAAELVGKDVFEEHALDWHINPDGSVEFIFDVRFNSELDRDTIVSWIRAQIAEHPVVKTWFLEIKVSWHTCDHDDAFPDGCLDPTLIRWEPGEPWPV